MEIMTNKLYNYQFDPHACEACGGHCCTGESGYIWAKYQEIETIADFLSLSVEDFSSQYLKKVKHRYSFIEKKLSPDNYACIFFDESKKRCSIYPVRPSQCRTFPFWEQFRDDEKSVREECVGII